MSKVYFRALPEEQVAAMAEGDKPAAAMMDGVPFYFVEIILPTLCKRYVQGPMQ